MFILGEEEMMTTSSAQPSSRCSLGELTVVFVLSRGPIVDIRNMDGAMGLLGKFQYSVVSRLTFHGV